VRGRARSVWLAATVRAHVFSKRGPTSSWSPSSNCPTSFKRGETHNLAFARSSAPHSTQACFSQSGDWRSDHHGVRRSHALRAPNLDGPRRSQLNRGPESQAPSLESIDSWPRITVAAVGITRFADRVVAVVVRIMRFPADVIAVVSGIIRFACRCHGRCLRNHSLRRSRHHPCRRNHDLCGKAAGTEHEVLEGFALFAPFGAVPNVTLPIPSHRHA